MPRGAKTLLNYDYKHIYFKCKLLYWSSITYNIVIYTAVKNQRENLALATRFKSVAAC